MKRKLFAEAEIAEPGDFEDIGLYAVEGSDHIVGGAIGYPNHWAGFSVEKIDAETIRVSPGRLFDSDIVYSSDEAEDISLRVNFPIVTGNRRWVGLIAQGLSETEAESRLVEEDAETGETINISVPKVATRSVSLVRAPGAVELSNDPTKPEVPADQSCIAFVLLGTAGIIDIVPGEAWRVKTLYEVEGRVSALEISLAGAFVRVATLETDLSNLAAKFAAMSIPRPEIIRQMRRDIAAMRRHDNVPEGARSDWYDPGLLLDKWDPNHSVWLARVAEGVAHPYASMKEVRLELANDDNPLLRASGRRFMPSWTEVKRIFNEGSGATRNISQQSHTIVNATRKSVSRTRTSYGPTIHICENMAEWAAIANSVYVGATFTKNGETFQVIEAIDPNPAHNMWAIRSFKQETYEEIYWEYTPEVIGVNGSIYGQTFLNANPMIATSVELDFVIAASDGGVHLMICDVDPTGVPLFDSVLAVGERTASGLSPGWNKFEIPPTYLEPGKRYAWFTVTVGNHQLRGTGNNAFNGGTSFFATDGAWAQGDLSFDFNFRVNAARFANTRSVIDFKAMTLENGMTEFSLLYPNWVPEGCGLVWEVKPTGLTEWTVVQPGAWADNPLAGLPAYVDLRCTILATPDLAPMVELTADAVVRTARVRADMRAVSKAIDLGLTTTQIQTVVVLDDFNPAIHTYTPRIMIGNGPALISPDTNVGTVDPDKPSRRTFLSTFTVPAGTQIVRIAPGTVSTNVVDVPFIQNAALFAL